LSGIHFVGAPTDEIRVRAHQRHEILNSLLTTPRESNQLRTAFVRPEFIFFARISERISRAIELENFAAPQRRLVSPHLLTVFVRRASAALGRMWVAENAGIDLRTLDLFPFERPQEPPSERLTTFQILC
jgi:hypothetical protein